MTEQKALTALNQGQVQQKFVIREADKVEAFLDNHAALVPLLLEARHQIVRYFPKSPVVLQIFTDPDDAVSDEQLVASIAVTLPPDEAMKKLDQLGEAWGLAAMERAEGKFCITIESR